MILLTERRIEVEKHIRDAFHTESGAVVTFIGTVREENRDGRKLRCLAYEAYAEMAQKRLEEMVEEVREKRGVRKALVIHRLGEVPVGEESILIALSSPHRREAFIACSWIIDTVKKDVPIWRKEVWEE